MANNKIQIKRSTANATVTGLSAGELAFTQAGNVFFIGAPDGTSGSIRIGGQMVPGTLTANQAMVVNATSGIDRIIVANLQTAFIYANGGAGTAGQVLYSNATSGAYWGAAPSSTTPGGADTQVQFNDGGTTLNATAAFTFSKATNTVSISNTLLVTVAVNAASHTTGSGYGSATGGAVVNTTHVGTGNSSSNSLLNYGSLTLNGTALVANSSGVYHTGVVNAASFTTGGGYQSVTGGAVVNATTIGLGNSTISASIAANTTVVYFTGTAYTANNATNLGGTAAASYQLNSTLAGNVALLTANNANNLGTVAAANYVQNTDSRTLSGNLTFTGANLVVSGTNTAISSNITLTGATLTGTSTDVTLRNGTFSGNLVVSGTVVTVNTQQLVVIDPIIELGANNSLVVSDAVDTGWFSPANSAAGIYYSGFARIAASSTNTNPLFRIFVSNTNPNTATTIDTSANTATGTLWSFLRPYNTGTGFVANATNVTITANSTLAVSITGNTLSLSGRANNDLLYTNGTGGVVGLALGTSGYVLQSNGTAIVYDTLDGGTF